MAGAQRLRAATRIELKPIFAPLSPWRSCRSPVPHQIRWADCGSSEQRVQVGRNRIHRDCRTVHHRQLEAFHSRKIVLERRRGGARFVTDINLIPRPGRKRLLKRWLGRRRGQARKRNTA
jgi:hypothetical protein